MMPKKVKNALTLTFLITVSVLMLSSITAAQKTSAASKEYKRLVALSAALKKIPMDKQDKEPHRSFLKKNDKDIVYSDPSAEWYVRSDRFWDLFKKYESLAIADQIAWTAADNPLPGECEGYVNCYLYNLRSTYGEYLMVKPKGAYSKKAARSIVKYLGYIADDIASAKKNYDGPTEASDRSEFAKMIEELREILTKVSNPDATKARNQLKLIEDAFK